MFNCDTNEVSPEISSLVQKLDILAARAIELHEFICRQHNHFPEPVFVYPLQVRYLHIEKVYFDIFGKNPSVPVPHLTAKTFIDAINKVDVTTFEQQLTGVADETKAKLVKIYFRLMVMKCAAFRRINPDITKTHADLVPH